MVCKYITSIILFVVALQEYMLLTVHAAGSRDLQYQDGILQSFRSPGYPSAYPAYEYYQWYLPAVPSSKVFYLVFFEIVLGSKEGSGACMPAESTLSLTQWKAGKRSKKIVACGSNNTAPIIKQIKKSQWSSILFRSGGKRTTFKGFSGSGFLSDADCGGVSYHIRSTIFPPMNGKVYMSNKKCVWLPSSKEPYRQLNTYVVFHYFELEYAINCTADYVQIWEPFGTNITYRHTQKYCGSVFENQSRQSFFKFNSNIAIVFASNQNISGGGFELSYFHSSEGCGGAKFISGDLAETITSPHSWHHYPANMTCSWFYYSQQNFTAYIEVIRMDVNATTNYCHGDKLSVFVGQLNAMTNASHKICQPESIKLETNRLLLTFESDSVVQGTGFLAKIYFSQSAPMSMSSLVPVTSRPVTPDKKKSKDNGLPAYSLYLIIGAGVIVIAIILLVVLILRRRKLKQQQEEEAAVTFHIGKRSSELPLVDTVTNKSKKNKKQKVTFSLRAPKNEVNFYGKEESESNAGKKSFQYTDVGFDGDEHLCEMYESQEDNRDSGRSFLEHQKELQKASATLSRDNEVKRAGTLKTSSYSTFYGNQDGSDNPDEAVLFKSHALELGSKDTNGGLLNMAFDSSDNEDENGQTSPLKRSLDEVKWRESASHIVLVDAEPVVLHARDSLESEDIYASPELANTVLSTKERSSTNELYTSMNFSAVEPQKDRSLTNELYGTIPDPEGDPSNERSSTNEFYAELPDTPASVLNKERSSTNEFYADLSLDERSNNNGLYASTESLPKEENPYSSSDNPLYGKESKPKEENPYSSSNNPLYGSSTQDIIAPVYKGATISSSHEDDYADLNEENYACPDTLSRSILEEQPEYAETKDLDQSNDLYASAGSYLGNDNPLYE